MAVTTRIREVSLVAVVVVLAVAVVLGVAGLTAFRRRDLVA